jgi:cbb3-type cytochrome oxidase subunit 1
MQGVARNFFTLAIIFSVLGMMLGLSMAMSHDHAQMPTHAHIMVLGWVMSSIFAFFYHLVPAARSSRLAIVHFWLSALSSIGLVIGLFLLYGGNPSAEPIAAICSMGFFAATLLFAFIALRVLWGAEQAGAAGRVAAH